MASDANCKFAWQNPCPRPWLPAALRTRYGPGMNLARLCLALALAFPSMEAAAAPFRAGAAVVDISPTNFPVIVNAMFTERSATQTVDRLHARAVVLDDGTNRIAIAVVDTCMMERALIDQAKREASGATGILPQRMLVSATHTHSAPSAMGCLGSRQDTNYAAFLPGKIAEAIVKANGALEPAQAGWTSFDDWDHTFNRRWIRRPDRMIEDPFGQRSVRAHMHPGHESPDAIGPSGPVDPAVTILALRRLDGRPLALLANYSMHYYESPLLSSDYFGRFATHIARMLGADEAFVPIMSQGTSGDLMWMDYGAPRKQVGQDAYASEIAERVKDAYAKIEFRDSVPLRMAERTLPLKYRVPDEARLKWAREMAAKLNGRLPQTLPEIYALEAIHLHERQRTELVLQALRVGDLGITAIPNEVYAITGLKLKNWSPFPMTMNIELANGSEGYIPPPEQHKLGGYTTWPARTAGLEVEAEPKIVDALLDLLHEVAGRSRGRDPRYLDKRHRIAIPLTARASPTFSHISGSRPVAFWRFEDMMAPVATDLLGLHNAVYEDGVALYLPGPGSGEGRSPNPKLTFFTFTAAGSINRAAHFAGGRVRASVRLPENYSAAMWIWNGLDPAARAVTGYFFSRGPENEEDVPGDHLGIGGTATPEAQGRLILFNGNRRNELLAGKTAIPLREWQHVALVREGNKARVYLNGQLEFSGELARTDNPGLATFIGGRTDNFCNFEGKIDEVAVFDYPLEAPVIRAHYEAAGLSTR